MATDLWINTEQLWGGDVSPGDENVVGAEFQMIGRTTGSLNLTFPSDVGPDVRTVGLHAEIRADLFRSGPRGQRLLGEDDDFETLIAKGRYDADGNVSFALGGIASVLAYRGTPLQLQYDVAPNAPDGMPISFGLPEVTSRNHRSRINVHHIGADYNPVYSVNAVEDVRLSFDLTSSADSFSPGDDDVTLGSIRIAADEPVYIGSVFVAVEGRHADNSVISNVSGVIDDLQLYDGMTGQTWNATLAGEVQGLEIYRFDSIYVEDVLSLDVRFDQEGAVANGDKLRIFAVTEPAGSDRHVDISGMTGPTMAYGLQAWPDDWNDRLIVTPGGTINGNFRKVVEPQLHVVVKAIGSEDTAVRNEDNINLLQMEVGADGEDLLFTQSTFYAAMGSLLNGQNFTLWGDTDGDLAVDTILQSGVASRDGRTVTFDSLVGGGFVIPEEQSVVLEVHMDVASSLMPDKTLQLGLLVPSVQAEELDNGASLAASQILVNASQPSKLWTFVNQGNLYVMQDATPTPSQYLVGGTRSSRPVARYELSAEFEDVEVPDFALFVPGVSNSADRFELVVSGTTQVIAMATVSGAGSEPVPSGGQTFWANMENRQLLVRKGTSVDLEVYERTDSDEQGGRSAERHRVDLVTTPTFVGVQARGATSSSNLLRNDGDAIAEGEVFIGVNVAASNRDIIGSEHIVVLSKVTSVTNANPDADGTNVPTGISPVGQFKFTAASHANTLNGLNTFELVKPVYSVSGTNESINVDLLRFYNTANSTVYASAVAIDGNGNVLHGNVVGSFRVYVDLRGTQVDRFVESGQSDTFTLAPSIVNSQITPSTSTLQISLLADETQWADPDIEAMDAVFTGLGLSDPIIRSTLYRS